MKYAKWSTVTGNWKMGQSNFDIKYYTSDLRPSGSGKVSCPEMKLRIVIHVIIHAYRYTCKR